MQSKASIVVSVMSRSIFGLGVFLVVVITWREVFAQSGVYSVKMSTDGRVLAGPDPTSFSDVFSILQLRQVVELLGLQDAQQEALEASGNEYRRLMKEAAEPLRAGLITPAEFIEFKKKIDGDGISSLQEILLDDQWKRLQQVAYRIEISRMGMKHAILHGRLSEQLEIAPTRKRSLQSELELLEDEANKRIIAIKEELEMKMLATLQPEQQVKAKELVGEIFTFDELRPMVDATKKGYEKYLENAKKLETKKLETK